MSEVINGPKESPLKALTWLICSVLFLLHRNPRANLLLLWKAFHIHSEAPNGIGEQSCKDT